MKLFKYVALLVMIVAGKYTYSKALTTAERRNAGVAVSILTNRALALQNNPVMSEDQRKNTESLLATLKEIGEDGKDDPVRVKLLETAERLEKKIHAIVPLRQVAEKEKIEKEEKEQTQRQQINAKAAFDKIQDEFAILMQKIENHPKEFKPSEQKEYENSAITLVEKMFNLLPTDLSKHSDQLIGLVKMIKNEYKKAINLQAIKVQNVLRKEIGWWPIDTSKEQKLFDDRVDELVRNLQKKQKDLQLGDQQEVLPGQLQGQERKSEAEIKFAHKKKEFADLMATIAKDAKAKRRKLSQYADQAIELVRQILSLIPQADRTMDDLQKLATQIKDDYKKAVDKQEKARVSSHAMAGGGLFSPKIKSTLSRQKFFNKKVGEIVDSLIPNVLSDQIFFPEGQPELQNLKDLQELQDVAQVEVEKAPIADAPVSPQLPKLPAPPVDKDKGKAKKPAENLPAVQELAKKEIDEKGTEQPPKTEDQKDNEKLATVMNTIKTSTSFANDVLKQYENNVIVVVRDLAAANPKRKVELERDIKKEYANALDKFAEKESQSNWFGGPREMDTEEKRFNDRIDKIFTGQDPKPVKISGVTMQDELESLTYQEFFDKFYNFVDSLSKNSSWEADKKQPTQAWEQQFVQFYKTNHELPLIGAIEKSAKEAIGQMRFNNSITGLGSAQLEDTVWDNLVSAAEK